ncbi:MAG: Rne/Rng family ribonuclease [Actinomycetota bacterium]|nr:Rne/Rng family ribonuclease [Actinomycetota bacterium]
MAGSADEQGSAPNGARPASRNRRRRGGRSGRVPAPGGTRRPDPRPGGAASSVATGGGSVATGSGRRSADPGSADPGSADPGSADPGSADPGSADPGNDRGATSPGSAHGPGEARPATDLVGGALAGAALDEIGSGRGRQIGRGGAGLADEDGAVGEDQRADDGERDDADSVATGSSRRRTGRERRGRALGRYTMCVHVRPHATQIAVLEGRTLVQHLVSRAADDATQIDGNIYLGRVQNVLPGMEAAFVDIGTPKNAVLYRGDVRYDRDDVETSAGGLPRIEEMLTPGQFIVCQVTKNPIGAKGARLTQEVSLPGRFAVMVPSSTAFGISKRLDDAERRRLRRIVDEIRPDGHGLIVRTAAEGASREELAADVQRLLGRWSSIEEAAERARTPALLYREPDMAVRIVREELNRDYRAVMIDDPSLFEEVRSYVAQVNPELVDRVELYDTAAERLPVFERFHVHEQLHKALDRKVWLPSGGSLIIERTEALTVIDVNTGKNVGTSNLEETVYRNNLEAADEIARQLRLRDIGGIIVIDFIDMEIRENREKVGAALRAALARDKTRTQVFDISELGLVEMTRKRVSEGLVESLSEVCAVCGGRGIVLDATLV